MTKLSKSNRGLVTVIKGMSHLSEAKLATVLNDLNVVSVRGKKVSQEILSRFMRLELGLRRRRFAKRG